MTGTIAELRIQVDTTQTVQGTAALKEFGAATNAVTKSLKDRKAAEEQLGKGATGGGAGGDTKPIKDISSAIDQQVKKLKNLDDQRKALSGSDLKTTNPQEYIRLNQVIDANIEMVKRQGTALDSLASKQQALVAIKDAASAKEAKVAADQQARLDATISGLSRQAKAQLDYNKTLEQLNAARDVGNGKNASGGQAQLSEGAYASWVKLAQAQRDSAYALVDNSKEVERAKGKLEQLTANLGKIERAEYRYAQAVKALDTNVKLGGISQEQYNAKLASFANARDKSIATAQNGVASEERFAKQLRNTVTAFDPVAQATLRYNAAVKTLGEGLESKKISIDTYNRALAEHKVALESVKAAQVSPEQKQAKQYQEALDRLLPYNSQLRNLEAAERTLQAAQASGKVVTQEQITAHKAATAALAAERAEIDRVTKAGQRRGNSAKQDAAALRGVPAQFTDIVVSLQGGQAPLTVLLQQGGQLKDMFGGVGQAVKAMGGYLLTLVSNPVVLAVAALGAVAYAFYDAAKSAGDINKALLTTGNSFGGTAEDARRLALTLTDTKSSTYDAVTAITSLASAGRGASENFNEIIEVALRLQKVAGVAVEETVASFAKIAKDPVAAVQELSSKYGILDSTILSHARQLTELGRTREAVSLIESEAARQTKDLTDKVVINYNGLGKAMNYFSEQYAKLKSTISNVGIAVDPLESKLAELNRAMDNRDRLAPGDKERGKYDEWIDSLRVELDALEQKRLADDDSIRRRKEENRLRAEGVVANAEAASSWLSLANASERYQKSLDILDGKIAETRVRIASGVSVEGDNETLSYQLKEQILLTKKLKEAKESEVKKVKGTSTPLDTTDSTDVKNKLSILRNDYDNYYKQVDNARETNSISEAQAAAKKLALLEQETTKVKAFYAEQLDAIKAMSGRKGNTESQNLKIANQLSSVQAEQVKVLADLETKKDSIAAKESGRLAKQESDFKTYVASLKSNLDELAAQGDQQAALVSMTSKEAEIYNERLALRKNYEQQVRELNKMKDEGTLDAVKYEERLAVEKEYLDKSYEQVKANADKKTEAESNWMGGISTGYSRWIEDASNAATQVSDAIGRSMDQATDALANFVLTGKMDFKSLAVSILSDLAKVAVKIAFVNALKAGASAFGGAGYTGAFGFANGGAFDSGVQKFAKGGAFTNSVYNKPTPFAMGGAFGGGMGVMGEAGPEAIMPLTRGPDGSLGVRSIGGGSKSSSGGVIVNISIAEGGQTTTDSNTNGMQQFGKEIGSFVEQKYNQLMSKDLKPGGQVYGAINAR